MSKYSQSTKHENNHIEFPVTMLKLLHVGIYKLVPRNRILPKNSLHSFDKSSISKGSLDSIPSYILL